jgi:hypothetical protein
MGQLCIPISLVFPLIHLLIESVDNHLLSVDNKTGLGITLTVPSTAPHPRCWTVLKTLPYSLYKRTGFSLILVNLACLFPRFHPQLYPHPCLLKVNSCYLCIVSSCRAAPTTSLISPELQLFPLLHKPYYDYYIYR